MTEYRFHRMTYNENSWGSPHSGRYGKTKDYVGENGFGLEDWNFSKDVWEDGKHHLYLVSMPAKKDLDLTFNIVLGVLTDIGYMVAGFAENVTYENAKLSDDIWIRRANELEQLDADDSLHGELKGLSVSEKAKRLKKFGKDGEYWVSLKPKDLTVLRDPIFLPDEIHKIKATRYQLLDMDEQKYKKIREYSLSVDAKPPNSQTSFPEGKLVERSHLARERSGKLVKLAKDGFINKHGHLFCEVCDWEPAKETRIAKLENKVIEAHHDFLPLGEYTSQMTTKLEDLRMLCPNCHRVIHAIRPFIRVDEYKQIFEKVK